MALSLGRMLLYLVGIALVVGALVMFFFYAGLNRWVPITMLVAGILLVIGLAVMGFADNAPSERHEVIEEPGTTYVRRREL